MVTGEEDAPLLTLDPVLLGVHGVGVRPLLSSPLRWLELTGGPDHLRQSPVSSGPRDPGSLRLRKQQQHLAGQCEASQLIFSVRLSTYCLDPVTPLEVGFLCISG